MYGNDDSTYGGFASSEQVVTWWADRVARTIRLDEPQATLRRMGVTLRVSAEPLRVPGRRIRGAWDPHLRRIELFGCDAACPDLELVETFGHELWHMLTEISRRVCADVSAVGPSRDPEAVAHLFATAWLQQLGPQGAHRCAAALRSQAEAKPPNEPHGTMF